MIRVLRQMTMQFQQRTGPVHALQQAQGRIYSVVQRQAAVLSYIDTFWIMGVLCLLAILLVSFAKRGKSGQAAMAH